MAEPVPAVELAGDDAQTVISLETLRVAPMMPRHLAAACGRQHALFRIGRQLREEARDIGGGADEAAWPMPSRAWDCRRESRRRSPNGSLPRVAARKRRALGKRRVRLGLAQACGLDDLAFDPDAIGLLRHRLRSTRPSRPKPWLEYLKRVPGSIAVGSFSSASSSLALR